YRNGGVTTAVLLEMTFTRSESDGRWHAAFFRTRSGSEMLRQLEPLRLVVRADALAVERVGSLRHLLVDEPTDDLAVLEDEGHFARAHLQHRARPAPAGACVTEAGVEESGIVHAKLAHQRIERHHLGGVVGRHLHRLFRREDGALVG